MLQACVSAALTACAPAALCFLCARGACSCARACACACACEVPAGACGAVGLSVCACVELCLCDAPAAVCALPERFAFCALRDARRLLRKYAPRWPPTPSCPCGRLRSRLAQEDT
ncbi:Protein of unknown function [Gryllus bimaculatus]|nr:Protein of unknown function [Gryllus bimaculatus]